MSEPEVLLRSNTVSATTKSTHLEDKVNDTSSDKHLLEAHPKTKNPPEISSGGTNLKARATCRARLHLFKSAGSNRIAVAISKAIA